MKDLQTKAVKSVFWVGGAKFASQIISWAITIILVRILTPEDYGLIGIALAYRMLVAVFFDLCLGEAILQKKEISEVDTGTAFWIIIVVTSILYFLTWNYSIDLAVFYGNEELVDIIRVTGLTLFFMAIKEVPNRILARQFEFKKRSQSEFASIMVSLITSVILAFNGYGVWALVIGELVKYAVVSLLIIYFAKWRPDFKFSITIAKQLLKYGTPVTGHHLLEFVSKKSDPLIIGKMLGQSVLGYYMIALTISQIPATRGVLIIEQVMFPLFSTLQSNIEQFQVYFYRVVYVISVMFFPVFLGMFAISEEIVVIVLSEKWLPSLFAFQIFSILGLLISYTGIFLVILKSRANTKALLRYSLLSAILFPMGFYLSSTYGLKGIMLFWLAGYPLIFMYLFYCVRKEIHVTIGETLNKISHSFFGGLAMVAVVLLVKEMIFQGQVSIMSMCVNIAVGAITYIGYFWLFSKKTFSDVRVIWNELRS